LPPASGAATVGVVGVRQTDTPRKVKEEYQTLQATSDVGISYFQTAVINALKDA